MQKILMALVVGCGLFAMASPSHAQATRTWVSGVGDDANPCSRTAPCKTFAGAISKTAPSGEISVLDPGGFGGLTITKSISLVAEGNEGSILVSGTNGITINAAATDEINIRGILIEGIGTGLVGINIIQAGSVHIDHCLIRNFRSGAAAAIAFSKNTATATNVTVSNCNFVNNTNGVLGNAPPVGASASILLDHVVISGTGPSGTGIGVQMATRASTTMANSTVTGNGTGLKATGAGKIFSLGNNTVNGNGVDGAPTNTVPPI